MVVAACAVLIASGRADFSESEIAAEVELLTGELRARYGFTDEQRREGLRAWVPIRRAIRHQLRPSTYQLWIRQLRPAGLTGGRLWLTGPSGVVGWGQRKYTGYIEEVAAGLGAEIKVGFMGFEQEAVNGAKA